MVRFLKEGEESDRRRQLIGERGLRSFKRVRGSGITLRGESRWGGRGMGMDWGIGVIGGLCWGKGGVFRSKKGSQGGCEPSLGKEGEMEEKRDCQGAWGGVVLKKKGNMLLTCKKTREKRRDSNRRKEGKKTKGKR